jgi:chromosome segregation ATPase
VQIKDLEKQLQEKEATEARLRQLNNELEAGRKDLMMSIEKITPKYQEALNDRGHFEHEITQALIRETATNKRVQAQIAEIAKFKEKNAATALELSAAQQALVASTIPEVAEMANLKGKIANLEADNERLKKGSSNLQNQIEYLRASYQTASTAAAESASELQELQATTAELRAKVNADTVRVHEIQRDSALAQHISTIKRLRSENEDLERECERRGELLSTHTNKRTSGRRTPVPRSPRIGGAMSPGPIRNVGRNFRAGSAGGSRGNSPAPNDLFGGNLDGSAVRAGSVRWGNHLQ